MLSTNLDEVANVIFGRLHFERPGVIIDRVCVDSRGASHGALFFALNGNRTDGHYFVADAFANGAAAVVVSEKFFSTIALKPLGPVITVSSPLTALQDLARWHRHKALAKVLVVTGSNGKTTVKDALSRLLAGWDVIASPGSFNSQIGLPLSVLAADKAYRLAILEAGVSAPGDMVSLESIAVPDYGILTNIGMAHFANFGSREAIAQEKFKLFTGIKDDGWVLLPAGEQKISPLVAKLRCRTYYFGSSEDLVAFHSCAVSSDGQIIELVSLSGERAKAHLSTSSPQIIADLHAASCAAYLLGVSLKDIAFLLDGYRPPATRMETWVSSEGIRIINDAYSSDPLSVDYALRAAALVSPPNSRRLFVFGGMRELGNRSEVEHHQVGIQAGEYGFDPIILVGDGDLTSTASGYQSRAPGGHVELARNFQELNDRLPLLLRPNDTVLFKGSRGTGMVRAIQTFTGNLSQRCLWIDLGRIAENIARLRRRCHNSKIIATLKALAYGTDLIQLASWLSDLGIQHFAVSSTDEGIALRKTGIKHDIYIFLSDPDDLPRLLAYRLTPILYSEEIADTFGAALRDHNGAALNVHLKIDTGMHRLGVMPPAAVAIAKRIRGYGMRLTGVCTHFASADDPAQDEYTRGQIALFNQVLDSLRVAGFLDFKVHAANTAATIRFPESHYDMVRVGLALYGVAPSEAVLKEMDLDLAISVTSKIAGITSFKKGDKLGYNGTHTANQSLRVAVIPFGYDDGLPWSLSGIGAAVVRGQSARIIGRVSMDQMQIDVTEIREARVGDEVLIYGERDGNIVRPEAVAASAGTIPHELLIRLGRRLRRIYVEP